MRPAPRYSRVPIGRIPRHRVWNSLEMQRSTVGVLQRSAEPYINGTPNTVLPFRTRYQMSRRVECLTLMSSSPTYRTPIQWGRDPGTATNFNLTSHLPGLMDNGLNYYTRPGRKTGHSVCLLHPDGSSRTSLDSDKRVTFRRGAIDL